MCHPRHSFPTSLTRTHTGPEDVEAAAALVGFPAVIKPITASASMGVVRVDSLEELKQKLAATQKQLNSLYLDERVSGFIDRSFKRRREGRGAMCIWLSIDQGLMLGRVCGCVFWGGGV